VPFRRFRATLLAFAGAFLASCSSEDPAPLAPAPEDPPFIAHRVLFVGNSLTYSNDLPGLVEGLARAASITPFEVNSVTYGGYSLEDHLNEGTAVRLLSEGGWDLIVLQQGPSTQPESRVALRRDVAIFASLAAPFETKVGIYGVWPPSGNAQLLDAGIESYRLAAADVNGLLFPAAAAWRAALQVDPNVPLYGGDAFHPAPLGSYLAAIVIGARIFDVSPLEFPSTLRLGIGRGERFVIPPEQAALVQSAAASVLQ
jgi:hypothetical protein